MQFFILRRILSTSAYYYDFDTARFSCLRLPINWRIKTLVALSLRSMRFNRNLMFMMILSGKKKQNQNQNLGLKVKTEVGNKIGVVLFNYMFHCSKWQ